MIQWNQDDLADPNNDLCSVVLIKVYVDVVQSHDGTWSAYFDSRTQREGLPTREAAMRFLEDFMAKRG